MHKHTSPPWTTREALDGSNYIAIVTEHNQGILAECFPQIRNGHENCIEECKANSRLFSAAPELLEALKRAMEEVIFPPDKISNVYDVCVAAIAKATGDQNV